MLDCWSDILKSNHLQEEIVFTSLSGECNWSEHIDMKTVVSFNLSVNTKQTQISYFVDYFCEQINGNV